MYSVVGNTVASLIPAKDINPPLGVAAGGSSNVKLSQIKHAELKVSMLQTIVVVTGSSICCKQIETTVGLKLLDQAVFCCHSHNYFHQVLYV